MSDSGIYGLTDEDAGEIRYVGRAFNIDKRYAAHRREGRAEAREALRRGWLRKVLSTKRNWLAYMELECKPVGLTLIERVEPDRRHQADREDYWATKLSALGTALANGTTAGTHIRSYQSKGTCPYTPELPTCRGQVIDPPDGRLRLKPSGLVIPVLEMPVIRKLRLTRPDLLAEMIAGKISIGAAVLESRAR